MLDIALVVIFQPFAHRAIAVINSDVAVLVRGSGLNKEGRGLVWGVVNQLTSECHHF